VSRRTASGQLASRRYQRRQYGIPICLRFIGYIVTASEQNTFPTLGVLLPASYRMTYDRLSLVRLGRKLKFTAKWREM
jgi:hypothetical protein